MIIRRISEGLKKQDWFVVMIEVMIVVVGIFIGLQVDDWNEGRKNIILEQRFLKSLLSETNQNINQIKRNIAVSEGEITKFKRVEGQLRANNVEDVVQKDLFFSFCTWFGIIPASYNFSTYNELVSTGQINIIRNIRLRQKLHYLDALHQRYQFERPLIWDIRKAIAQDYRPYVRWNFEHKFSPSGAGCKVDIVALSKQPQLISGLAELAETYVILGFFYKNELQELEAIALMLEKEIETGSDE